MEDKPQQVMLTRITWQEFHETGLWLIINQILHIFGFALTRIVDDETKEIKEVYMARCRFRGFSPKATGEAYDKVA